MSVKPAVLRRLMRELQELKTNPPEGIRVQTSEENMLDIIGIIQGPEGTPYANGYFKVKFHFTEEFPAAPPKCRMLTKIFHPNFSASGEICVNTLKKDWQASFGISHILVTIKCLLIHPNPESALDEEAGKLLLENYDDYCSRARLITSVHAKTRPPEFADAVKAASSSSKATSSGDTNAASSSKVAPSVALASTPADTDELPPIIAMAGEVPTVAAVPAQRAISTSHTSENNEVSTSTKDAVKSKADRQSPAPLGTNDGNVASKAREPVPKAKAVKRVATAASGVEKKKKALKRL